MKKITFILLLTLIALSSIGQNQFSDYVNHLENNTPILKPLESFVMEWYGVRYRLGGSTKKVLTVPNLPKNYIGKFMG